MRSSWRTPFSRPRWPLPGWRSQRTFTLDTEACRAIAAALKEH
jgi:hypothetical protein